MREVDVLAEDIIICAIKDFESFFIKSYNFKVKVKVRYDNSILHASIKGFEDKSFIRFSSDLCLMEINNNEDFIFILNIVGHELAHYVNHHNYLIKDTSTNRILEAWADRCGVKILLCTLFNGYYIKSLYRKKGYDSSIEGLTKLIGKVFFKLADNLFNINSEYYYERLIRVMHCVAGVNSYFDDVFGNKNLDRAYVVMHNIYMNSGLTNLISENILSISPDLEELQKIRQIHYDLQKDQNSITPGMKTLYEKFIGTSYFPNDNLSALSKINMLYDYALQSNKPSKFGLAKTLFGNNNP